MAMLYEDIRLVTISEPIRVRARVITASLSDGSEIRVGVFRRNFEWNFTDIDTGGKMAGYADYLQAKAITKFNAFISEISPARYAAAREKLQAECGRLPRS